MFLEKFGRYVKDVTALGYSRNERHPPKIIRNSHFFYVKTGKKLGIPILCTKDDQTWEFECHLYPPNQKCA